MVQNTHIFKTGKVIILLFFTLSFFTCDKKQNPVPNVFVDIPLDLNDPLYNSLTIPGNFLYITGGVNGILVFHSFDGEFKAFDRTCTYDTDCGFVTVNKETYRAVDLECCQSEYSLLLDGAVEVGPAEFPLKQYKCVYNQNTNYLQITN